MKRIELEIVETGTKVAAKLLEEEAPATCAALWKALEQPIETQMLHGIWLGRTLEVGVPTINQRFDPEKVSMENATIRPLPGDILWKYHPPKAIRGLESPLWDIMIVYGPEAIMRNPAGFAPANVWAEMTENKETFCAECAGLWFGKAQTIRITRME